MMLALGLFLFAQLGYSWWWFPLLILSPDIGMLPTHDQARIIDARDGADVVTRQGRGVHFEASRCWLTEG